MWVSFECSAAASIVEAFIVHHMLVGSADTEPQVVVAVVAMLSLCLLYVI